MPRTSTSTNGTWQNLTWTGHFVHFPVGPVGMTEFLASHAAIHLLSCSTHTVGLGAVTPWHHLSHVAVPESSDVDFTEEFH